jgi:hypothetical protein
MRFRYAAGLEKLGRDSVNKSEPRDDIVARPRKIVFPIRQLLITYRHAERSLLDRQIPSLECEAEPLSESERELGY